MHREYKISLWSGWTLDVYGWWMDPLAFNSQWRLNTIVFWDSETWNLYLFVDLKCRGKSYSRVWFEFHQSHTTTNTRCGVPSMWCLRWSNSSACSEGIKRKLKQNFELTLVKPRFSRGHSPLLTCTPKPLQPGSNLAGILTCSPGHKNVNGR